MRKGAFQETSLSLQDILPTNPKFYDKNRPPKVDGQATVVFFHVTVLSLDSINEESMVCVCFHSTISLLNNNLIITCDTSLFKLNLDNEQYYTKFLLLVSVSSWQSRYSII